MTLIATHPWLFSRYSTTFRTHHGVSYKTVCACKNPGAERDACQHHRINDEDRICECACHGPRKWEDGRYVDGASTASEAWGREREVNQ